MQQLPNNTLLQGGRYKIEKVLGQGGFGITYLASQELLERKVCIKEFFFKDSCDRTSTGEVVLGTVGNKDLVKRFLNKFIKEARTISKLEHPNIIRILDIFMENGTAYYVMDFIEGESLEDIAKRRGALPEHEAIGYIKQVASALDYLHQRKINHLDVKPANIMVRKKDNKAILIDFGVSKQYDEQGEQTSTTPVGISYGYAPIEQYRSGGVSEFSPQTDIYSLGATLYRLVTGNIPPQATDLLNEESLFIPKNVFSSKIRALILESMKVKKNDRPTSICSLMKSFSVQHNSVLANLLYQKGEFYESNNEDEVALSLYDEASRMGCADAYYRLGEMYEFGHGKFCDENKEEANKCFKKAVELWTIDVADGKVDAMYHLGLCYYEGIRVEENILEGIGLLKRAAELGNAEAQDMYGEILWKGEVVGKNKTEALRWYEKSAKQNAENAYWLGMRYEDGDYIDKDEAKAFYWYEYAAKQGCIIAMIELAKCYKEGRCVTKNMEKSTVYYRLAAMLGDKGAQFDLGELLWDGLGGNVNKIEATKWYVKAAEQDTNYAYLLGRKYLEGDKIKEDMEKAIQWFERGANAIRPAVGKVNSMIKLIEIYSQNEDFKNIVRAKYWCKRMIEEGLSKLLFDKFNKNIIDKMMSYQ